jgi:hypothetical protein
MKMMSVLMMLGLMSSLMAAEVFQEGPAEANDPRYFEISDVKIEETDKEYFSATESFDLGKIVMAADQLIALGKKVWTIVEAGKPVVNSDFAPSVSVLPQSKNPNAAFYDMENWSSPRTKSYKVTYTNGFGMNVVVFEYGVVYQYGGQLDGKGKYLTAVDLVPMNVEVAWGYSFDAKSTLVNISNVGSKDSPVAAARLKLSYTVSTVLKSSQTSVGFYVQGDGQFQRSH